MTFVTLGVTPSGDAMIVQKGVLAMGDRVVTGDRTYVRLGPGTWESGTEIYFGRNWDFIFARPQTRAEMLTGFFFSFFVFCFSYIFWFCFFFCFFGSFSLQLGFHIQPDGILQRTKLIGLTGIPWSLFTFK